MTPVKLNQAKARKQLDRDPGQRRPVVEMYVWHAGRQDEFWKFVSSHYSGTATCFRCGNPDTPRHLCIPRLR